MLTLLFMVFGRVFWLSILALPATACGSTSRDHDALPAMGGTSGTGGSASSGGSNTGGNSSGGASSTGGSSNSGGTSSTGGGLGSGGTAGTSSAGSSAGGSPPSEGPGTITDLWRDFCVATFTEDYQVKDAFMTPLFIARAGEEYLVTYYTEPYGSAKLAYLTSTGPYEFDVAPNADHTAFPFTTDCATDLNASKYFAVFSDVSVYAEPELTTKLCDLTAGTALPHDEATNAGYGLEQNGPTGSIYEIFLNAFSAQCGGAASGYISVPTIQLFGTPHVVVPFRLIPG